MIRAFFLGTLLCTIPAPALAEVRYVRAGENLQAALDAAKPGDELRLAPDTTFTGNFVLPAIAGTALITVRTDLPDAALPGPAQRVTPATASRFARIASPNTAPALRMAPGAHHWRLMFLEFPATKGGHGDIVQLGDGSTAQSQLSQVPYEIVVDRVYIHGDPEAGQKRGIALNSGATTIRNCYVSDIKAVGTDAQAIGGWNGPGPYSIENNYLEASGEVFLLGGADPAIANLVTSDVLVRYNHMTRPMAWRGSAWQIKNIFELKNARRVRVEYNLFENNWQAAQPGYAIVLTPRNQNGGCRWCVVEAVEFTHNIVRNCTAGMNILGYDSNNRTLQTNTIRVVDNLFLGITTRLGGNGWGILIGDEPRDVTIERNTFDIDGTTVLYVYGGTAAAPRRITGFRFTNNATPHREYGINGASASSGTLALQMYFPAAVVTGNWFSGGNPAKYPAGNRFDVPFDPDVTVTGADAGKLRPLLETIPKGLMVGVLQPPKNLRITSSAK
jgi:hypothetical protein